MAKELGAKNAVVKLMLVGALTTGCETAAVVPAVPAPVAEPVAAPAVAAPEVEPIDEVQVRAVVDEWVAAQNGGDFPKYATLFAEDFEGVKRVGEQESKFERAAWLQDRQRMFEKRMVVAVSDIELTILDGFAVVRFTQTWQSGDFRDVGPKELVIRRLGDELLISREEMLRSTVGANRHRAAAGVTTAQLLAADAIYVFSAEETVLFDSRARNGPRCERAGSGCSNSWIYLNAPLASDVVRKSITAEQARQYLEILTSRSSYGAPPAACYLGRLSLAFYHDGESIPWATVGVCIECLTLGGWPAFAEMREAQPEEGSGLGPGIDKIRDWCAGLGLSYCVAHRTYIERETAR